MKKNELTQAMLMAEVHYDPETGEFTRLTAKGGTKVGDQCGHIGKNGYRWLNVCGHQYYAHRLAWLYVYGRWPQRNIDHINRDPLDNRLVNLRDVPQIKNAHNSRMHSNNTSGHSGVYWFKPARLWNARIRKKGRETSLGYFKTREGAVQARLAAEREHYGFD